MESDPAQSTSTTPPLVPVRWIHLGSAYLDLPITPASVSTSYVAFSENESAQMEAAWQKLSKEEQEATLAMNPGAQAIALKEKKKLEEEKKKAKEEARKSSSKPGDISSSVPVAEAEKVGVEQKEQLEANSKALDRDIENEPMGIPVGQDGLFEVDVKLMRMVPVFWMHSAIIPVVRATWFYSPSQPVEDELATLLESAYQRIQPWQPSYQEELQASISSGSSAEDKLKGNLSDKDGSVIFLDKDSGRLFSAGVTGWMSKSLWMSMKGGPRSLAGYMVYRGYDAVVTANTVSSDKNKETSRRSSRASSTGRPSGDFTRADIKSAFSDVGEQVSEALKENVAKEAAVDEQFPIEAEVGEPECTDLVLVVHGIGQHLASAPGHEAFNFIYAVNIIRREAQKQSASPALQSIMRNKRVQFLPIQWRSNLQLGQSKAEEEEDAQHMLGNRFTLDEITIKKSIPYVRELTNNVLIDIPYFMSHHKVSMLEAVALSANRAYRLWVRRHPKFVENGRVHIIGHSLGSALVADILSDQATTLPPISSLPKQVIMDTKNRFLFNVTNFFMVGSPLGLFLHLHQAQLIARRGKSRTMNSPFDEALERSGRFGCLSVDSIYNIFHPSDPIAYMLNAAVDSDLGRKMNPLAISSVTAGLMASFSESVGKMSWILPSLPSMPSIPIPSFGGTSTPEKLPEATNPTNQPIKRPGTTREPSAMEMMDPSGEEELTGSRAERRFKALNPHGNIDFYLPSAGLSEYLDMVTAHGSYWQDPAFSAFVLAEVFATKSDLMRTGMGTKPETNVITPAAVTPHTESNEAIGL